MTKIKIQLTELPWKKLFLSALIAGSLTALSVPVRAIDSNFVATSGASQNLSILNGGSSVTISPVSANNAGGNTVTIGSTAVNPVLGWVLFGSGTEPINAADVINYSVPAGSAVLNTVSGGASTISGTITSNGRVYVLNTAGITLANTAVLSTAGFYASAIPENISYFIANGNLQAFSSTPSASTTTGSIVASFTNGTASSGNIFLAGNGVTVGGGQVNGNLQVISTGGAVTLGSASALAVTGTLAVQSQGGSLAVTGANAVTVTGASTLDTATLASTPGNITQGAGAFATGGLTINAGTSGTVTLSKDDFGSGKTLTITAGTTSLTSVVNKTFTLGNSVIDGTFSLTGTSALNGTVTLNNLTVNAGGTAGDILTINTLLGNGTVTSTAGTSVTLTGTAAGQWENINVGTGSLTLTANGTNTGSGGLVFDPNVTTSALTTTTNTTSNIETSTQFEYSGLGVNGALSITSNGNITLPNWLGDVFTTTSATASPPVAPTAPAPIPDFKGTNFTITATNGGTINFGTSNITATTGFTVSAPTTVTLPASVITANKLLVTSTGGNITQPAGGTLLESGTTASETFTASSAGATITLGGTANNFSGGTGIISIVGGAGGVAVTSGAGSMTLGTGTSVTGPAVYTGTGQITLGLATADTLSFASTLNISTTGAAAGNSIATISNNVSVFGNVTLANTGAAASNAITLGSSAVGTGITNYSFGTINATTAAGGAVNLYENTTMSLGTITTTGALTATSASGNIVNPTGIVTSAGATFNAGTSLVAPGTVTIGSTTTPAAISGNIIGNVIGTLNLVNSVPTTIGNGVSTATLPVANVTLSGSVGQTLTTTENIGTLSFNISGTDSVSVGNGAVTQGNLTLTNSSATGGTTGVTAINITVGNSGGATTPATLTLGGGINLLTVGTTTFTANGNTKSNITDTSNSPVFINGPVVLSSTGGINIANNSQNSFGPVTLTQLAGDNQALNYTEGGTVNLGGITMTGTGALNVASVNGSIIEQPAASIVQAATGVAVSLSAPNGLITLTNQSPTSGSTGNQIQGILSASAGTAGTSAIWFNNAASGAIVLGNVTDYTGGFTFDGVDGAVAFTPNVTISQSAGTAIFIYGNSTFKEGGNGAANTGISLTNSGNNFGAITAGGLTNATLGVGPGQNGVLGTSMDSQPITIVENGTSNYSDVQTTGLFTASSQAGSIIELSGGFGINQSSLAGGVSGSSFTVSAPGASIALTDTTNDFGAKGIKLTTAAGLNASVTDADINTFLADGTNVGGALTVSNVNVGAGATIADAGATNGSITVGGLLSVSLPTGSANKVNFTGANNNIASVSIKAGSGTSVFTDSANLALVGTSNVAGPITITANSITTPGNLPISFGSTVNMTAQIGSIVLSNTNLFVTGQLTVSGATGSNLSALSLLNNLSGIAPINRGNAYVPPGP